MKSHSFSIAILFASIIIFCLSANASAVEVISWGYYWPSPYEGYTLAVGNVGIYTSDILWENPTTGIIEPISDFSQEVAIHVGFFIEGPLSVGYLDGLNSDEILFDKYLEGYWFDSDYSGVLGIGGIPTGMIVNIDFSPEDGFGTDNDFNLALDSDVLTYTAGIMNDFVSGSGRISFASSPDTTDFVPDALNRLPACGVDVQMGKILLTQTPEPTTIVFFSLGGLLIRKKSR